MVKIGERAGFGRPLSWRLFLIPHLAHFTAGTLTVLYFIFLDPGTFDLPGQGSERSAWELYTLGAVLGALIHPTAAVLFVRRTREAAAARRKPREEWTPHDRELVAETLLQLPRYLLVDTLIAWLVLGAIVGGYGVVAMSPLRGIQIFFGTALVGGSTANLVGYLLSDYLVRGEIEREFGSLDVMPGSGRLRLPGILLSFLFVVGIVPVSVATLLAYSYVSLLATDAAGVAVLGRLARSALFVWLLSLVVTAVCVGWIHASVFRPLSGLSEFMKRLARGDFQARVPVASTDALGQIASSFNRMAGELAERERLRDMFGRYVSEDVLKQLLEGDLAFDPGGERREVAVVFVDIRGFSGMAERLALERTMEVMTGYFETMTEPILDEGGTVLEYLGDGILAIFGAPVPSDDPATRAVRAGVRMIDLLDDLNRTHRARGEPGIEVGLGIHHGEVIVGNIGSSRRMKYGAVGDAVNVAARIQELTRERRARLPISDEVRRRLTERVATEPLGRVSLKGREEEVGLHKVR